MIDKIKKLALNACNMKDSLVLQLCAAVHFVIYFVVDNYMLEAATLVTLTLLVIGSMIVSQLEKLNGDD